MTTLAHQHARQATILALAAYALFSLGDATMKLVAHAHHYPPALFLVCTGTFLILAAFARLGPRGEIHRLYTTPNLRRHLLRACLVCVISPLTATAITTLPLPDFYSIIFLVPFIGVILAYFILGEEVGAHRIAAIAAGFVGVIILAQPQFDNPNIGYLLTLIAAVLIAFHMIVLRKLVGADPFVVSTFYPGVGMLVSGSVLLWQHPVWPAIVDLPYFLFYALVFMAAQTCFVTAFTRTPITALIAPLVYSQMLWGIVYGYVLFHTLPNLYTLIGAGIVMIAGMTMMLMDARKRRVVFAHKHVATA